MLGVTIKSLMNKQSSPISDGDNTGLGWKTWAGLIGVPVAFAVFVIFWGWEGFSSEKIDQRGAAFRNFGLPILAVGGIALAVWRSITAQKQADTAAQQASTAARSLQNDRYQKGAEMLGSKELSVRVGGISALARLAQDEPETYHYQIMVLFGLFVRHPTPDINWDTASSEDARCVHRPDVKAIFQAIHKRTKEQLALDANEMVPFLPNTNLRAAPLPEKNLSWCYLPDVDFTGAILQGTNLTGSELDSANLTSANLNLADLTNASPIAANLTGAFLNSTNLTRAKLSSANLTNASLSFANLTGAGLQFANLAEAVLLCANLTDADFSNAKHLTQAQLDEACQNPQGNPPHNLPKGLVWKKEKAKKHWGVMLEHRPRNIGG